MDSKLHKKILFYTLCLSLVVLGATSVVLLTAITEIPNDINLSTFEQKLGVFVMLGGTFSFAVYAIISVSRELPKTLLAISNKSN
ncbi:MAG TPA: hypothetical protein HA319_04120 [Nitrosopumilaceae archaeon]|nr:hypothetical protein [Nitrosopumilaceae archaeon]